MFERLRYRLPSLGAVSITAGSCGRGYRAAAALKVANRSRASGSTSWLPRVEIRGRRDSSGCVKRAHASQRLQGAGQRQEGGKRDEGATRRRGCLLKQRRWPGAG